MHQYRLSRLFIAVGLSLATSSALASPQSFMSSRSFAMGGTGVAIAHPASATSANPAMMASDQHDWADDFGLTLPSVNVRVADEEETIDQVDDIQDSIDRLESAIDSANSTDAQQQAGELRKQLAAFDKDTVRANLGPGFALAVPGKKISVGVFTNGNLTATVRGEYDESDDAILEDIEDGTLVYAPGQTVNLKSRGKVLASAVVEAGPSFAYALEIRNEQSSGPPRLPLKRGPFRGI